VRHADLNEPLRRYERSAAWDAARRAAMLKRGEIRKHYLARLAASMPTKTGTAKAVSLLALDQPNDGTEKPGENAVTPAQLAEIFLDLPADRQLALLSYEWDWIDHEAVKPALITIYETASDGDPNHIDREPDLRCAALGRLYHWQRATPLACPTQGMTLLPGRSGARPGPQTRAHRERFYDLIAHSLARVADRGRRREASPGGRPLVRAGVAV
jgi:hypothetical protein